MDTKNVIMDAVEDLVADFLYYDRKEDEDLKFGDIELAIKEGVVSVDEITDKFKNILIENIE
jgi:hypothetical protein